MTHTNLYQDICHHTIFPCIFVLFSRHHQNHCFIFVPWPSWPENTLSQATHRDFGLLLSSRTKNEVKKVHYWPYKTIKLWRDEKGEKLMPWGIRLNFQLLTCPPVSLVHSRVDWLINILVNPSVLPEWVTMGRGHMADEKREQKMVWCQLGMQYFLHSDSSSLYTFNSFWVSILRRQVGHSLVLFLEKVHWPWST